MNMNFARDSLLLSTIYPINSKIDRNEREDLQFSNYMVHQNQYLYQNPENFCINPPTKNQHQFSKCLFEEILAKCSTQTNATNQDNHFWVSDDDILGISSEIEISPQNLPKIEESLQIKRKYSIKKAPLIKKFKKLTRKESKQAKTKRLQLQHKLRTETKNIPKNYGKAIIGFIIKHQKQSLHHAEKCGITFENFKKEMKQIKRKIKTIADVRSLWMCSKYAKLIRGMGNLFLRKYSFEYIFNSKIESTNAHVKYRCKLLKAIRDPESFQFIKGL